MAGAYDGSIRINTKLNTQGFDAGIRNMTASFGKLAAIFGIAFSVASLVKMGQQAIDLASDIQEVDNVVSKSFGNMRNEMDALADTAIEKLGMSKLTAYQTGSTFMSMGQSMVDSMEEAKDMALELTNLTGNMSSFFNVGQGTASTALKSIYTGETETLKQFGVVMTETNLQQFAYEQGIRKTLAAMTQSEKVMLRYKYVTEQLSYIGNDFVDTQDSWANQTRILSEQWNELLSILGGGLVTVLTPAVSWLNEIVASLIDVADAIGTVMSAFGVEAQSLDNSAQSAVAAAEAMGEYSAAIDDAEKSAGKLAAFDDINLLSGTEETGTTAVTSDGTFVDDVSEKKAELSELEKAACRIKELLTDGLQQGFITNKTREDIEKNLEGIKKSIVEIFKDPEVQQAMEDFGEETVITVGTVPAAAASITQSVSTGITGGFKDALENPNLKSFSSKKITSIFEDLTKSQKTIQNTATAFAEIATAFESEDFKNINEFLTKLGVFNTLDSLDFFVGFFADLAEFFSAPIVENSEEWTELLENVFELLSNIIGPAEELLDIFTKDSSIYEDSWLHALMKGWADDSAEYTNEILTDVNDLLEGLINVTEGFSLSDIEEWFISGEDVEEWWNTNIEPWFTKEKWDELLYNAGQSFGEWWTGVVNWWNNDIPTWWEEDVTPWFTKEKWIAELDNIKSAVTEVWDNSFGKMGSDISVWFEEDIKPWLSKEKWQELGQNMKDGLYSGFKAAVTTIIDLLNQIISSAENSINTVVGGINSFIDGYNSVVPDGMTIGTLSNVGFGRIPYPALAKGAVFRGGNPYLAVVNDQPAGQTNIEAPLDTIRQGLREELENRGGVGVGNMTVVLELDGKQLAKAQLPYLENENARVGTNLRIRTV